VTFWVPHGSEYESDIFWMLCHAALKKLTNVSEVLITFIIRAMNDDE
jgi:hypothetical protein